MSFARPRTCALGLCPPPSDGMCPVITRVTWQVASMVRSGLAGLSLCVCLRRHVVGANTVVR
eukprot:6724266-Prymnesium_polylepis.1